MARVHFAIKDLSRGLRSAKTRLVPLLRTPAALAAFASLAIHGVVLLALPLNPTTKQKEVALRTVQVVELTPLEQSRLPRISSTPDLSDKTSLDFRYRSLPTEKLPPPLPPLDLSRTLGTPFPGGSLEITRQSPDPRRQQQREIRIDLNDKADKKSNKSSASDSLKSELTTEPAIASPKAETSQRSPEQPAEKPEEKGEPPARNNQDPQQPLTQKLAQKIGQPVSEADASNEWLAWYQDLIERQVPAELIIKAQNNRDAPPLNIPCPDKTPCAEKIDKVSVNPFFMMVVANRQGQVVGEPLVVLTGDKQLDQAIIRQVEEQVQALKPQPESEEEYRVIHYKIRFVNAA